MLKGKAIVSQKSKKSGQSFLQPLVVAIVCLVFISLALIMKLMDLQTLDSTLDSYMESRGLGIVENVRQLTQNYFQRLAQTQQEVFVVESDSIDAEDFTDLEESFVHTLLETAQEIDLKWNIQPTGLNQLLSYAAEENLWLIAFIDDLGNVVSTNRPVPGALLTSAASVFQGKEEITVNLYNQSKESGWVSFIALRRESGNGSILLALNFNGFRYRGLKVAIQRAVADINQSHDTVYFIVMDLKKNILAAAGEATPWDLEETASEYFRSGRRKVVSRKVQAGGQKLFEILAPIHFADEIRGVARLALNRDKADKIIKENKVSGIISMGLMVMITVLSMWFLYKNQNRHLASVREMESRIRQAEKISALGRLGAGVAHEIRNPLNAISMAIQRLRDDNLPKIKAMVRDEIRRLDHIIEEFLSLSGNRKLNFKRFDLKKCLNEIIFLLRQEAESKAITFHTNWVDSPVVVYMDPDKVKQALLNILKNAMESISDGGAITLCLEYRDGQWLVMKISDTGCGLSAEEIKHIFDPDYTTKEKGLGLGLTIAHHIIRDYGGELFVSSRPGEGTTFEIRFPCERVQAKDMT